MMRRANQVRPTHFREPSVGRLSLRRLHASIPDRESFLTMTSAEQNAATLQAVYQLVKAGRIDEVLEKYYLDSSTLHVFGSNALTGVYRGKPEIKSFFARMGALAGLDFSLVELLTNDRAAAGYYALGVTTGREQVRWNRMNLYLIQENRIASAFIHESDQALVDRLYPKTG
jgi:hypothetical protein